MGDWDYGFALRSGIHSSANGSFLCHAIQAVPYTNAKFFSITLRGCLLERIAEETVSAKVYRLSHTQNLWCEILGLLFLFPFSCELNCKTTLQCARRGLLLAPAAGTDGNKPQSAASDCPLDICSIPALGRRCRSKESCLPADSIPA